MKNGKMEETNDHKTTFMFDFNKYYQISHILLIEFLWSIDFLWLNTFCVGRADIFMLRIFFAHFCPSDAQLHLCECQKVGWICSKPLWLKFLWNAPCITNLPSQTDFSGHYFKNNHFDAIFWRKSRHRYIILIDKDNSSAWPPVVWLFKFLKQTSFSQFFWTEKTRELNCIV